MNLVYQSLFCTDLWHGYSKAQFFFKANCEQACILIKQTQTYQIVGFPQRDMREVSVNLGAIPTLNYMLVPTMSYIEESDTFHKWRAQGRG